MAEINESIWGPKEKWINIDANQPSGKPDNQILKGAWFEDPNRGTIEYGLSNDKLELETDWDNSLSYAGFGYKAPLSNIDWWYVGEGETNQLQQLRSDTRTRTNFAIGSNGHAANNFYKIQGPTYSPAQRPWNDRWNCGAEFSSVSGYSDFIPWTQIPIKRIVLVPLVHGWSSDFESDGYYELGNYLDNHLQDRPYITTVSARIYYDRACEYNPETGTGTINRIYIGEFNTAILEHSTYGDGYEDEEGNDETGIYQPLYGNSDRGPIMGPLVDRSLPGNQTSGVWCVPVANGFGLEWNKLSHSNEDFVVDVNSNSRIYLNTNDYTKEQLREGMRQAIACYGMFFADGADEARFLPLDDDKMMLGILEDGLGNGKYSHGEDNRLQDQWNWDDLHENEYDPDSKPPEPGDNPSPSGDPMLPTGLDWTLATAGGAIWALDNSDIREVWNDIFGKDIKLKDFGDNPMNAILSLEWTPFIWSSNTSGPVVLGSQVVNPNHIYPIIESAGSAEIHGEGQMRFKFNKNFYNARNMQARLFLPFYGYYELPTAQLLSSQLRLDFYYNVPDELGVYIISYDKVIYDFVECSCKIDIPLTGSNAAALRENKKAQALTIASQVAAAAVAVGVGAFSGGLGSWISAEAEVAGKGVISSVAGGIRNAWGNIGSYSELFNTFGGVAGATGLTTAGINIANTIHNGKIQRAALKTNLPYHGSALQTTFLHMSMKPYVQIFKNAILGGLTTSKGGTVEVELGNEDEKQYMLKVGHACDVFTTIDKMPENSLLQTTGCANMSSMGMELAEYQELNSILQSGFYK